MLKPSVPVGRAYYFELTPRSRRLLYYVPLRTLRRRVVRKEVLRDFPFGLEVEVDEAEFQLVSVSLSPLRLYGISMATSPPTTICRVPGFGMRTRPLNSA